MYLLNNNDYIDLDETGGAKRSGFGNKNAKGTPGKSGVGNEEVRGEMRDRQIMMCTPGRKGWKESDV